MRIASLLGLCVLISGSAQVIDLGSPARVRQAEKPIVSFEGKHSGVNKRVYRKITGPNGWAKTWVEHVGAKWYGTPYEWYHNTAGVPKIDFDRCMVVAVFGGQTVYTAAYHAHSILEKETHIRLRYDARTYQPTPVSPEDFTEPELDQAYGMFVIPKSSKTIVLEENTQSTLGGPPVWTEKARL